MNHLYINNFFTSKKIKDILNSKDFDSMAFQMEMCQNYNYISKHYRNEFFFKSTLFNRLVLGKYSIKTAVAFNEMIVSKSKADFVLINKNKGTVYEIKTDLDNLDRLIYQLEDYSKAFSEVYVVTTEKNYYPVYRVLKETDSTAGIIVLTERNYLSIRKKAIKNVNNLDYETLFKLLRKSEYKELLFTRYSALPKVTPVQFFKASLQWFKEIHIEDAQLLVMKELSKRIRPENYFTLKELPLPLRWLVYKGNFNYIEIEEIYIKLRENRG